MVTASPIDRTGLEVGRVLADRYQIVEHLDSDSFGSQYRVTDLPSQARALMRIFEPSIFATEEERHAVLQRLLAAVGVGGRFLPGLTDAGIDGPWLFAVEPAPPGASLRQVLDVRATEGRVLKAEELLPVMARIAAALEAIPPPLHHGDMRPERLWFDADGLYVTGAFILPALPERAIVQVLTRNADLARHFAPEAQRGGTGDAADRYGAALIAHEALTNHLPRQNQSSLARTLGETGDALHGLLQADPAARDKNLDRLIDALARVSGLPVPDLASNPFRRPRRRRVSDVAASSPDALHPADDTKRIKSLGLRPPQSPKPDPTTEPGEGAMARNAVDTDAFDPRLVRAALDVSLEVEAHAESESEIPHQESGSDLDARLVRAALGVQLETEEAAESELSSVEVELEAEDLLPWGEEDDFDDDLSPPPSSRAPEAEPPHEIPRAHPDTTLPDETANGYYDSQEVVLFDDGSPISSIPPDFAVDEDAPPQRAFDARALGNVPAMRPAKVPARPPRPRSMTGAWILLGAIALAAAIIVAALYVKKQRDRGYEDQLGQHAQQAD